MNKRLIAFILGMLVLIGTASARSVSWTDTYDMLIRAIGFKAPRVLSYNNFAVEWIKENPDGTLTIHMVEVG
jgi:hypothetical protein